MKETARCFNWSAIGAHRCSTSLFRDLKVCCMKLWEIAFRKYYRTGMPDWHFRSQKHQKLAAWRSCWLRKKSGRMPTKVGTILAACGICWLRTNIFRMPTDVGIILAACKNLSMHFSILAIKWKGFLIYICKLGVFRKWVLALQNSAGCHSYRLWQKPNIPSLAFIKDRVC